MTDRELMQMALATLEDIHPGNMTPTAEEAWNKAIDLIHARLSQCDRCGEVNPAEIHTCTPKREWQGLTDDDINNHWITAMWNTEGTRLPIPEFARAIEAKLKEKNT